MMKNRRRVGYSYIGKVYFDSFSDVVIEFVYNFDCFFFDI